MLNHNDCNEQQDPVLLTQLSVLYVCLSTNPQNVRKMFLQLDDDRHQ